jgi:flagellar basal body-associated protein FliL
MTQQPLVSQGLIIIIIIIIIIITYLLTPIEFSLVGSSPYTSTEKTNKNKYT